MSKLPLCHFMKHTTDVVIFLFKLLAVSSRRADLGISWTYVGNCCGLYDLII